MARKVSGPKDAAPPDCAALCQAVTDAAIQVAQAAAAYQAALNAYNAAVANARAAGCQC